MWNNDNPDYKLEDFVKEVLIKRFPGNYHKQKLNDDDPSKLNFACPYCGDSQRDSSKKRGNIYHKTDTYKCFNDGCLTWVPLRKFISKFALKYSIPIPNIKKQVVPNKIQHATKRGSLIEFLMNPKVKKSLINFKDLQERFFLTPCKDAPEDSIVGAYVRNRKINTLPTFEQTCYYDSREDKIYIFNLDLRSGRVLGLSIRHIDENWRGPRYDIVNYSQFIKNGLIDPIEESIVTKIDIINNYFNILNVNFNQPIYVTEGQIDAMFLRNAIATTGVTKSKTILGTLVSKKNALILFDNDKGGKEESLKLIQQGYRVFLWTKLISDLNKEFNKDRRHISNIKDINDLYKFLSERKPEINFDEFNELISNYFSESLYDMLFV